MVAYSFKRQFEEPIRRGVKTGTIRALGKKRHARPSDLLQLYVGMRTRQCKLIAYAVCIERFIIKIDFLNEIVRLYQGEQFYRVIARADELAEFARDDGFLDFTEMRKFWRKTRGVESFDGVLIRWDLRRLEVAP